jgi:hypothetical protein
MKAKNRDLPLEIKQRFCMAFDSMMLEEEEVKEKNKSGKG